MYKFDSKKLLVVDMGAGSYYREQGGHERFNLDKSDIDGKYYGFCPHDDSVDICRHFGAPDRDGHIDGVLVVYVSKKENSNDREIIAFCPNARVFGRPQSGDGLNRQFQNKKTGEIMTASYCIVSEDLIKVSSNRMTIVNNDKDVVSAVNSDIKTANRLRGQRFYGEKYPYLSQQIITFVEQILSGSLSDDDEVREQILIQQATSPSQKEITDSASRPIKKAIGSQGAYIVKDSRYAKAALIKAKYRCQVDGNHSTFKTTRDLPYMEGHHLIPCTIGNASVFYDRFNVNIDCVENILCVCPTCHRAVHFGDKDTKTKIIKALFQKQKSALMQIGVAITEQELLELYGCQN